MKYQVMRDLTIEEYSDLRDSIIKSGVLVPIVFDENGNIIDGHHRKKICDELHITNVPKQIIANLTENEKLKLARELNEARRQLTIEEKEREARKRLKETPELSDRQIAKQIGASNVYVSGIRKDMEQAGEVLTVNTSIGADGKAYPRNPAKETNRIPNVSDHSQMISQAFDKVTNSEMLDFSNGGIPDFAPIALTPEDKEELERWDIGCKIIKMINNISIKSEWLTAEYVPYVALYKDMGSEDLISAIDDAISYLDRFKKAILESKKIRLVK